MVNIFKNLGLKNNTNAMTPIQIEQIGEILPNKKDISVLEFGAGNTTVLLYNALKSKYNNVTYVTYEDNILWAPDHKEIQVRMYDKDDLISGKLIIPKNEKYDIVIVDGPDGELRKYWYPLFSKNINKDTIIHIDDAFHYDSFEIEFRKTFPLAEDLYVVKLGESIGNKCWITSKIL